MRKCVAIVLARGGSKGIPGKNALDFCGKPLLAWSILQAKMANNVEEVYLSSDSEELLNIGKQNGAELIKRPAEFATDEATSESAVLHALSVIGDEGAEDILMLEPTAPLRKCNDIQNAVEKFRENNWDSCFSGAELESFLIWKYNDSGVLDSINYDYRAQCPRQMRKPDYVENGAVYLFRRTVMLENRNRFGGNIGIFPNEFWQSFEIDSPEDWGFVELIFKHYLIDDYQKKFRET